MERKILNEQILLWYKDYLVETEKSNLTVEKYMRDCIKFFRFAKGRTVTKELTTKYKQTLIEEGYAPRSINSMIIAINGLFGQLGWNECNVKLLRIQREIYCTESKSMSKAEYLRLLKASEGTQLNLIMQTICSTGIRISELRFFTVEAVQRGKIDLRCKGKVRTILIPKKLQKVLLAYAHRNIIKNGPIFLNSKGSPMDRSIIWRKMKALCVSAGVEAGKVFPHNLRKLFAKCFYKMEKDIAKLADILGHSSIETTRIYIMETGDEHRRKIDRLNLVFGT